jgi:Tol biopolymer transport system component
MQRIPGKIKTKCILLLILSLPAAMSLYAQKQIADTNYSNRVTSVTWMPDGKSLLFSVVKFHKYNQDAPFFSKVFRYVFATGRILELFENGSNLAPSPDGKTIAFLKRDDKRSADIYLYDIEKRKQSLLSSDTTKKNALSWSPDGKKIVYNISHKRDKQEATVDICVLNLVTRSMTQVTHSDPYMSYSPAWCPDSEKIAYYLEKGDGHDQIWLTDDEGSFHTNLTRDTTTHNYFPSWIDERTVFYTQSPETIMTMRIDSGKKQILEGINNYHAKYSAAAGMFAYVTEDPENTVVIYDWINKKTEILVNDKRIKQLF